MKNILALLAWLALCLPAFAQAPASPLPASLLGAGVQQVATGVNHSCALSTAGAVQCWGDNYYGQLGDGTTIDRKTPTAVTGLASGVVAIAAGSRYSCALTSAGAVQCWGFNDYGQLGDGSTTHRPTPTAVTGLTGVAAIAAGDYHSCALTSAGAVQCWGDNGYGQLGDGSTTHRPTPTAVSGLASGVAAIAAGNGHSCALTSAGAVQCWGRNSYGQLGDGSTTRRHTPTAVTGLASGVAAIAAGSAHSCALTSAGAVQCWGENGSGQLGDGSTAQRNTPTAVFGLASGVAAIAAGNGHSCALTSAGAVQCWGLNSYGQLGNGSTIYRPTPTAVSGLGSGVAAIAVGSVHSCALTSAGAVQCWGYNISGQLGDGSTAQRNTPTAVTGLASGVATIAVGSLHNCALTTTGGVQCWGNNGVGQLGDGTTIDRKTPTAVFGLSSGVVAIAVGDDHSCALTSAGAVQCWGYNISGQLGDGSTTSSKTPTAVTGLGSGVVAIAAGRAHSCALTNAGAVQCWGNNADGQLGDGSTFSSKTPTAVTGLTSGVAAIAAGRVHSCALTSAGAVQCWGNNADGQLGDGSTTHRPTPTAVFGLASGVAAIAVGNGHSCALTSAGAVQCWGDNDYGQLGDGSNTQRKTPTAVSGLSDVTAIAVGYVHSCALTSAGAMQCWGYNGVGQLGDGSVTARTMPTAVTGLASGVAAIAAGSNHSCALSSAGAVQCWGHNGYSQLGDGSTITKKTPTHIAASQALAFAPVTPAPLRAGSSTALSATASSALAVAFDTWTPDVCTVSGNTLSVLPGKANHLCGVRALQVGGTGADNTHFIAAPQRRQLLSIEDQENAPDAPTAVTAVAGDGTVTLTWTAPASDGGSALTGYTVTGSPSGSCTAAPPATTCTISGLTNGTLYTFTVAATNSVGVGMASAPSSAVAPIAPLLGVCGTSHGVVTPAAPPIGSNLCSAGSWASYTGGAYGWAWKCNGTNGGAQASCQAPKGYTVTPSASGNGSISPAAPQVVAVNTSASFTVTPQTGHSAALGGTCGGSLSGSTYTTNFITGACTVQASFAPATYPITTSASPASGGTVACTPNPVEHGQDSTCSATPATGYQFTGWTGACSGTGACQLSSVTSARSVGVTFGLAPAPAACASTTVLHAATNGSGDGSSWLQPAALQQALALANGDADLGQCYEIRLRQGVYKPGPAGRPELHFAIDRPMQIKGGYTGNAAQPEERVLYAGNTVLSGDIGGDDDVNAQGITEVARFSSSDGSTPLPGNQHVGINSYHVVVIGGAVDDGNGNGSYTATEGDARFTLLEGLTITAGGTSVDWGAIAEFDSKGSGLLCNGAGTGRQCSPALRHLHFSGHYGWAGGGLFNNGQRSGNSSPVIAGTTFSGNWVAQWGSALFNNAVSSGTSSPGITNSTFSGNHAVLDGAAVYNDGAGARPTVGHSTFSGNAVTDTAIGAILYGRSSMTASIVWDNTGKPIGGTGATVTYSIVQGGRAGTGNLSVDPLLGTLQDNGGATPTQLSASGSPAIDAVDCAAAPAIDQRGLARPQGSRCDLGAVEVVPPLVHGACGVADGVAARTAPVAQLCSVGVEGSVDASAADAFVWPCAGTGGGATAQCSAPRQYLVTLDIAGDGTATPASPLAVAYGQAAQFTLAPGVGQVVASASGCGGSLSGSTYTTGAVTADCTVSAGFHQPPPPPPPPPPGPDPIDGACGTSHGQTLPVAPQTNLCRSGTASAVSGTGPWSWSCSGQYGGGHASCSAQVSAPPPTQGPVLDEDFVRQQYLDLLHRSADGAGLAYWHEQLRSGQVSRAELVQRFVVSTEFQGRIAPIVRLYFAYFGRVPDYAGLQFWINTMYPQGMPSVVGLDSVSQAFAASPEFERTYGALSDADFVGLVYRNVLDREPEGPGQTHWLAQLQNGLSRGSLMAQFSESAEYQDFTQDAGQVVIAYVGLLRRAPETAGFEHWLNYLEQGGSFMQLIDGLLDSLEYNQRFAVP